jgi:hypothetical protein
MPAGESGEEPEARPVGRLNPAPPTQASQGRLLEPGDPAGPVGGGSGPGRARASARGEAKPGRVAPFSPETNLSTGEAEALSDDPEDPTEEADSPAEETDSPTEEEEPAVEGTGSLTFTILDPSERPVAEVWVSLHSVVSGAPEAAAVTGASGEALFGGLAAGTYSYRVEAPGRPELVSASPIVLAEGERKNLMLRLGGLNLSISGRVLNQFGRPVPGIEISAVRWMMNEPLVRHAQTGQTTRTLQDGSYVIQGLDEGDYLLRTTATAIYPSIRLAVRAGLDSVDLRLVESLRVHGTVANTSAELLHRVRVTPTGQADRQAYSDTQGSYEVYLTLKPGQEVYSLAFYLEGYEEELLSLDASQLAGTPALRLDAELRALRDTAIVSGVVKTRRGEPISGVPIFLRSASLRTDYRSASDGNGNFRIPDVKIGSDYRLTLLPRSTYRDYLQEPIAVTGSGAYFDVVLDPLVSGRVSGRMIDGAGNPIPNFRLWLVNADAQLNSVPVSSDDSGYFLVEDAPEGVLLFHTRSYPMLRVTGVRLPPGGAADVLLPLDWGNHVMSGSVVDGLGDPVAGAEVSLFWSHQGGGLESTSTRKTVTDQRGFFRLSQLGPGLHRLDVRADGYQALQEGYNVVGDSSEVEVQIERHQSR